MDEVMSAAFLENHCLAQPLKAMSQNMIQAECVDHMWDRCSSKVLKSGCILAGRVTLEQLSSHEFTCIYTRQERDFAGMLFDMNAL